MWGSVDARVSDRSGCLRLLAGQGVGRFVFTDAGAITTRSVAYVSDAGEFFLLAGAGTLAAATRDGVVVFEVDRFDPRTGSGCRVLGVGEVYEIIDPERLARLLRHSSSTGCAHDRSAHVLGVRLRMLSLGSGGDGAGLRTDSASAVMG